jgi:hypothetical protein
MDLLASRFRRLTRDPTPIVTPYVRADVTVLEPGPGMGFFTLELGRLVGPSGRVIAVDFQPDGRRLTPPRSQGRPGYSTTSMPAWFRRRRWPSATLKELLTSCSPLPWCMKCRGQVHSSPKPLALAEPAGHVDDQEFARELAAAVQAGLTLSAIRRYTVVAPRCCANQPPEWRLP